MPTQSLLQRQLPPLRSREEMIDLLLNNEYGHMPQIPYTMEVSEPKIVDKRYCCGKAQYSYVNMTITTEYGSHTFRVNRLLHIDGQDHPFFVFINFTPAVPDKYLPAEEIMENGFSMLSFCYSDVTADNGDFTDGLAKCLLPNGQDTPTACGKLMIWAWAAMRVMDYAQTLSGLDFQQAALVGHSRLGKTALLGSMLDERFRYAISNDSGCGGAALTRGKNGESIADILNKFYYWFCPQFKEFADHYPPDFDQHYLLSSIAPRYVYVCSASMDDWADPDSEFLNCIAASEEFKRQGLPGFICDNAFPGDDVTFHEGTIGYHRRPGMHFLSRHDWHRFMAFIRLHSKDEK